jgi:hypothetical protein
MFYLPQRLMGPSLDGMMNLRKQLFVFARAKVSSFGSQREWPLVSRSLEYLMFPVSLNQDCLKNE